MWSDVLALERTVEPFHVAVLLRRVGTDEAEMGAQKGAAFLNFLPAYWEPLSHWSVIFEQSSLATSTASTSDSMAMSVVASVLNR